MFLFIYLNKIINLFIKLQSSTTNSLKVDKSNHFYYSDLNIKFNFSFSFYCVNTSIIVTVIYPMTSLYDPP